MLFQHGYALIVGVGRSAYPAWSLPTTAGDAAALHAALTDPTLCAYPGDEVVRLSHLAAHLSRTPCRTARAGCARPSKPPSTTAQDDSVAAGAGGIAIGRVGSQVDIDRQRRQEAP